MSDEIQKSDPLKDIQVPDGYMLISNQQLQQISDAMAEYKGDIIQLVGLFNCFQGMFSGNVSILNIASALPKLMKDESIKQRFATVVPIIEKYTAHGEEK